jgi:hypothetical protein
MKEAVRRKTFCLRAYEGLPWMPKLSATGSLWHHALAICAQAQSAPRTCTCTCLDIESSAHLCNPSPSTGANWSRR